MVDVGGGVGSQTLTLAKSYDHLKYIVQDREAVITGSAPGVRDPSSTFPSQLTHKYSSTGRNISPKLSLQAE